MDKGSSIFRLLTPVKTQRVCIRRNYKEFKNVKLIFIHDIIEKPDLLDTILNTSFEECHLKLNDILNFKFF